MKFTKMHGTGNDFIVLDALRNELGISDYSAFARKFCDRNFGIGADGVILIEPSSVAEIKMRIINADGSEPEMCGNGIRCFAKYVYENGIIKKEMISVETGAGIIVPALILENGIVKAVEVDMGEPRLLRKEIPMTDGDPDARVIDEAFKIQNSKLKISCVSMGNPHCVIIVDNVHQVDVAGIGSAIETSAQFPQRTNVEFVQVIDRNTIQMRVWERGVGETLACGTGACAAVVVTALLNKTDRQVMVQLAGGNLQITWDPEDNHVEMTGEAETVYSGELLG